MPDLSVTTELLRLLGDPTRVRLLALLGREELPAREGDDEAPLATQPTQQNGCPAATAPTGKKPRRRAEP